MAGMGRKESEEAAGRILVTGVQAGGMGNYAEPRSGVGSKLRQT